MPLPPRRPSFPSVTTRRRSPYFPVGYTDADGRVRITQLPPETDGIIDAEGLEAANGAQSVGGSIKLFFQKLVWSHSSSRHAYHRLTLLRHDGEPVAYHGQENEAKALHTIRQALQSGDVLLLMHGMIGDTKNMTKAVFDHPKLAGRFRAILAFDYEPFHSDMEKTAAALLEMLANCQVPAQSLTMVAHSTGGLVARYLIENLDGGAVLVKKLVQLGTPNAGIDVADLRKKLAGWMTLGMNGIDWFKPYQTIASFLPGSPGERSFHILEQMAPASDFLVALNNPAKPRPGVPYFLIAGDTSQSMASDADHDPLWKKVWLAVKERADHASDTAVFEDTPNDMAVPLLSMQTLPWGTHEVTYVLPCSHIRYFIDEKSLGLLYDMV